MILEQAAENEYSSIKKDNFQAMSERDVEVSMTNQSNRIDIQPLENKLRMRVENYFGFLPEKLWQLCESKNWRGKL